MSWYYVSVVMKATSLALGRMETHSMRPTSLNTSTQKGAFLFGRIPAYERSAGLGDAQHRRKPRRAGELCKP